MSDVRMIEASAASERFARGWHLLGLTREYDDGVPHSVEAFGTKLVIWKSASGEVNVLDAYCRHTGASCASVPRRKCMRPRSDCLSRKRRVLVSVSPLGSTLIA